VNRGDWHGTSADNFSPDAGNGVDEAIANRPFLLAPEHSDEQASVGLPNDSFTVLALEHLVESVHDLDGCDPMRILQILKEVISFGVDVRRGEMCELARRTTEADALVEDR
jgi:hypothetical protein